MRHLFIGGFKLVNVIDFGAKNIGIDIAIDQFAGCKPPMA